MRNELRALAAGGAAYITWTALRPTSKIRVAEPDRQSEFTRILQHYAANILLVALWKTFQERTSESSLKRIAA